MARKFYFSIVILLLLVFPLSLVSHLVYLLQTALMKIGRTAFSKVVCAFRNEAIITQ